MVLNKKAIIFTFMAILIATLLTMIYASFEITPLDAKVSVEKSKISTINDFLSILIEYTSGSVEIAGYRALQGMTEYVRMNGFFSGENDIENSFIECALNGTLKGTACPFMENTTVTYMIESVKNISRTELGYNNTQITIKNLQLEQNKPFAVTVHMNVSIFLRSNNVFWNITRDISQDISIAGIKDPVYFRLPYNQTFRQTQTLTGTFNSSAFEKFVLEGEYKTSQTGLEFDTFGPGYKPLSFFGRLANDSAVKNDPYLTIISIVSPAKLEAAGIPLSNQPKNVSYVDFLFKKELQDCTILKKVAYDTSGAIVDRYHLTQEFGINGTDMIDSTC